MKFRIDFIRAYSLKDIRKGVFETLEKYRDLLPEVKTARILLKPNLNSNMNALTGNTTDLRLIASVIEFLKENGYTGITIGEGTNSGFYRNNISVLSRLAVDRLAEYYGVKVVDLNFSEKIDIPFEDGVMAGVAKECMETDFFINMPKLKTHFEIGMSVCLKNLMGCLVGQENKKKTHKNLSKNILNINRRVKPHLHIIDGLIAMEGLGPTRGTPVNTGLIIVGTDPYLIDLVCAKIAGFDHRDIKTLKMAEDEGTITKGYHQFVESLDLSNMIRKFKPPRANPLVSFIHSPKRQRYFLAIRNTAFFNWLCSTKFIGKLLFKSGLRQDNFIKEDMVFKGLKLDKSRCPAECDKCSAYCPVGLKLPEELKGENLAIGGSVATLQGRLGRQCCIGCLYCFLVCRTGAIEFNGLLGFMAEQIRQYDKLTKKVV